MKLETENVQESEASAELIRELMADDAKRGEFMILFDETDDENFVQVACDYDDVGGKSDGRVRATDVSTWNIAPVMGVRFSTARAV